MFFSRRIILVTGMMLTLLASACASSQPITEPVAVVEAFYEALNDGDIDTAMGFVDDDVSFSFRGGGLDKTNETGKSQFQEHFQQVLDRNTQHELSDLILEGDTVTWVLRATSTLGPNSGPEEAVIQEGRIVSFQSDVFKFAS